MRFISVVASSAVSDSGETEICLPLERRGTERAMLKVRNGLVVVAIGEKAEMRAYVSNSMI